MPQQRCTWMVDHGADEAPTVCGRVAVVTYVRFGSRRGERTAVAEYPRCTRHDTAHARAIIDASEEWEVADVA